MAAWYYEKDLDTFNWKRYFDAQIKQKILPKLHGSINDLDETLENLLRKCLGNDNPLPKDENEINKEVVKYYSSSKKLFKMRKTLMKKRYVSFI